MTNEDQSTHSPQAAPKKADLSKLIDAAVDRLPNEQVRAVRVFDDLYRCNWWTMSRSDWLGSATSRISRSKLLRVVQKGNGLVIDDVSAG